MKPSDLKILLRDGEGTMLEYKETLPSSFARELVAFSCPEPQSEETGFFTATFFPNPEVRAQAVAQSDTVTEQVTAHVPHIYPPSTPQVTPQVESPEVTPEVAPEVTRGVVRLLSVLKGTVDRRSLQKALGLKVEKNFRLVYLRPALQLGLVEMTLPDKPRSSKQRYRITPEGIEILKKTKEKK